VSSEIVAGFGGGLLALAGAFGVQWMTMRHENRRQARQLAAEFLTTLHGVEFRIDFARDYDSYDVQVERALKTIEFQDRFTTVGHHLELASDKATARSIRAVINAGLRAFQAGTDPALKATITDRIADFDTAATVAARRIVERFGHGVE
jgi:hypothetical protein